MQLAQGPTRTLGGAPGDRDRPAPAAAQAEAPPDDMCTMTVLCQGRRLDLAVPATLRCAELLPMLLRILLSTNPAGPDHQTGMHRSTASGNNEPASPGLPAVASWQLAAVGGPPIRAAETLRTAGVCNGAVLELRQGTGTGAASAMSGTVRDRIEDVVCEHGRFWTEDTTLVCTHMLVIVVATGLLIPVTQLPLGLGTAGLAATLAVALSVLAATMSRTSGNTYAAVAVVVGCGWAWLAGTSAFVSWTALPAPSGRSTAAALLELPGKVGPPGDWLAIPAVLAGVLAALLVAVCSASQFPAALVHTAALVVLATAASMLAAAVRLGIPATAAGNVIGVLAVLAMGGLPRAALLAGGLATMGVLGETGEVEVRFGRADRVLTGCVIGVSLVAAAAAMPGAFADDRLLRLFAVGLGLALLLRSRAFSQVPHAVGPRIAGLLVFVAVWVGAYRGASSIEAGLLLVTATGAVGLAMVAAGRRPAGSPVGMARLSRFFAITEQALVVLLVVLAVGTAGLFDRLSEVLG